MTLLPAVEHTTHPEPDASVIWLHGLGADGNDFAPIVPQLGLAENYKIRFLFPHAPSMPVTVNGGFVMPAWYDILQMEIDRRIDTRGLLQSVTEIQKFVERERERGIDSSRIVIAGFSQGGAVAYHLALEYPEKLAGLLAMSTYFATMDTVKIAETATDLPVLIQHGLFDPVVPESLGKKAVSFLESKGFSAAYQTFPMEHAVCPDQIEEISNWLQTLLK